MKKRSLILWLIWSLPVLVYTQNCGLEAPLPINPNATHFYDFEIFDVVNDDLSNPNQGVCGIEIFFGHNYISDLEIYIISPAGQVIQIIGPNTDDFDAFTTGGLWNISFVPCGDAADPDFPYASNWNNNINDFIPVGNFSGSYYPFVGCLEDFDTGPVNGTWTLQVVNDPTAAFIPGQIFDFRIVLCDDTGQNCCFAEAGNLADVPDVAACEGDSSLQLQNIDPEYTFASPATDTVNYGYTFAIGQNGTLVAYDSTLDFRNYQAGVYEICGLSYRRMDTLSFLIPDGNLTIEELRDTLDLPEPPYCAELTDSCFQVTIYEVPEPVALTDSICIGDTYSIGDSTFTLSGNYPVVLQTANGCDSLVNLELVVLDIPIVELDSVICEGDLVMIGSSTYDSDGMYADTLQTNFGCDSIVRLNLSVLVPVDTAFTAYICEGETYTLGTSDYQQAGNYVDTLISSQGCDSIINLTLEILSPEVIFTSPEILTCAMPEVTLDGSNSMPSGEITYQWTDFDGTNLGESPSILADSAGFYILEITQSLQGVSCTARDTIELMAEQGLPQADAGGTDSLTCAMPTLNIGGPNTSTGPEFSYSWTTSDGNIVSGFNDPVATVDSTGTYYLTVNNTNNGCQQIDSVQIFADTIPPIAMPEIGLILNCGIQQDTLSALGASPNDGFSYSWTGPCIISNPDSIAIVVDCPGDYQLSVLDNENGCVATAVTTVDIDTLSPQIMIEEPAFLNCEVEQQMLNATVMDAGSSFTIDWQATNGGNITDNAGSLGPQIDAPGIYTLTITNPSNFCESTAAVTVIDTITNPQAIIQVDGILDCNNTSLSLDGSNSTIAENVIAAWTTTNGNILNDTSNYLIEVDAPGGYTLEIIDTFTLCRAQEVITVQQDTTPPLAEAGPSQTLNCTNESVILTADGSSTGPAFIYNWTGPCILTDPNDFNITVDCMGTYYLEVSNTETACTTVDSIIVMEDFTTPVVNIAPPALLNCEVEEVQLDANGTTENDRVTYQWTGPGIIMNADSLNPTVNQAGVYQLIVTDTISNCVDSASVTVDSYTFQPVADAGAGGIITCQDSIIDLGTGLTSTGPNIVYAWTSNESTILSGVDSNFAQVDTAGVFILFVTDTLSACADTSFVTVTQNVIPPGVNAGNDLEIDCSTSSVDLQATIGNSGDPLLIQWSGDCIDTAPDQSGITVSCPDTYFIEVTNTLNGCLSRDSVVVAFDSLAPIADLVAQTAISCETGEATLDGSASSFGFYQWFYEGNPITGTQNTLTVDQLGIYQLVVSNLDMSCSDTATTEVILDCAPNIVLAAIDTISCAVSSIVLDASATEATGPITYDWTGPAPGCIQNGANTATPQVQCGGDYTLIATNLEVNQSDTLIITVPTDTISPVANAGPNDTINCVNEFAIIDGSLSSVGPEITYSWAQSLFDEISQQQVDTVYSAGSYLLTVTDTTNGCASQDVMVVTNLAVNLNILFGSGVIPCNTDTFALQSVVNPPSANYVFSWQGPGVIDQQDQPTVLIDQAGMYIVSVMDTVNSCSAVDTIMVSQQTCLTCVEIAPPDTLTCALDSTTLQASYCLPCVDCELEWNTLDGNISSGANTLQPVVNAAGTYVLSVTDTLNQITEFSVTVVENVALPNVNAGPDQSLDCDSPEAILQGSSSSSGELTYEWVSLSGNTPQPNDQPTLLVAQADTFVLRITDENNACVNTDTVLVTEDLTPPQAEAGPEQAISCGENLVILQGDGSSLGLNFDYTWTSADNFPINGANTANPIVENSGWYFLEVENQLNGCIAIDSVFVNALFDEPTFDSIPDLVLNCQDTIGQLSTNIQAEPGFSYSYEWCLLDGNGQAVNCTDTSLTISVIEAGSWQLEVVNDSSACIATQIVEVIQDTLPPLVEAGNDITFLCTQDSLSLNGIADTDLSISWSADGDQVLSNDSILQPFVYEPGLYTLTALSDSNFCTAFDTVRVSLEEGFPEVEAGPDSLLTCLVESIELSGTFSTESGNATINWVNTAMQPIENPDNINAIITEPGVYYLTITDPENECTNADSLIITQNINPPSAQITADQGQLINCISDTLLLDGILSMPADSGSLVFRWSTVDGNIINAVADTSIQINQGGTYQLIVTDEINGCMDTTNVLIDENTTIPTAVISEPDTIDCDQTTVTLDGTASNGAGTLSYQWTQADGTIIISDTFPSLEATSGGMYLLEVVDLLNGCSNTATAQVPVDTIAPIAVIQEVDELDCDTRFVELSGVGSSTGPLIDYVWFAQSGEITGPVDSISTEVGSAGTYVLQVTNSRNGCTEEAEVAVAENEAAILGVSLNVNSPDCFGDTNGSIELLGVEGGTFPFMYALDGTVFGSQTEWLNLPAGTYQLSVLDANGCEWIEEVLVDAPEEIVVDLGVDVTIQLGDSTQLEAIVNEPYDTLIWSPANAFEDINDPVQVVQPKEEAYYQVMVMDENGCIARDSIVVFVSKPRSLFVPTAFSPNDDGSNDVFMIYGGSDIRIIKSFKIFDRWGNQVFGKEEFQPNDPTYGWDGNFNGQEMNSAVYVYFVEYEYIDGWIAFLEGDVLLMR